MLILEETNADYIEILDSPLVISGLSSKKTSPTKTLPSKTTPTEAAPTITLSTDALPSKTSPTNASPFNNDFQNTIYNDPKAFVV